MAPALPVYTREEIENMYPKLNGGDRSDSSGGAMKRGEIPSGCELYELLQNQCTYDGNKVYCLPFKRMFLRCLENKEKEVIGYKLTPLHRSTTSRFDIDGRKGTKVHRNIEITCEEDNRYAYDDGVKEFLRADRILREKIQQYYGKMG